MKKQDAENDSPHCSDASPYGVGCAKWEMVGDMGEERHACNGEHKESPNPKGVLKTGFRLGFAEAECEPTFA